VEKIEVNSDYENPWTYLDVVFDGSLIGDNYGFVYCITNRITRKKYIGRKYFWSKRKPRLTANSGKRRRVTSESNWRNYYGSSPELTADVKEYGRDTFTRQIISLHSTPGKVNFEETRQLFLNNVLTESLTDGTPAFYNSNILGRYYRKDYFPYDT
tara:strand:- start:1125 stop:1592 length:468 start_codon:yes stop_codon:yes gene_type:complete